MINGCEWFLQFIILTRRVYGFLETNQVLCTQQFGFRKNYFTAQTLLNICQNVMDALDNRKYACGDVIVLQKAFDTIDHENFTQKTLFKTTMGYVVMHFLYLGPT